jgi:hypothetical protein
MTPDDHADEARKRHAAMYPKKPQKRRGATPEAKVKAQVEKYLAKIGALTLRTGAGVLTVGERVITIGRAGGADLTVCLPTTLTGGRAAFCVVETKAATGALTAAQRRYLDKVRALGGLAIVARSAEDVRAALVAAFGEAAVARCEGREGKGSDAPRTLLHLRRGAEGEHRRPQKGTDADRLVRPAQRRRPR